MSTETSVEKRCQAIEDKQASHKLLLYNDDNHTMGEVVNQICKAIQCNSQTALQKMKEAHTSGTVVVLTSGLEECRKAERVLKEIHLTTAVERISLCTTLSKKR